MNRSLAGITNPHVAHVVYDDHQIFWGDGDQDRHEANPQSEIQHRAETLSPGITCESRGIHSATARIEKASVRGDGVFVESTYGAFHQFAEHEWKH